MSEPTLQCAADEIDTLIARLAEEVSAAHPEGLVIVGVLKGCLFLVADLIRMLHVPVRVDFFALSSYEPGEARVRIVKDLDIDVRGEDVVLVEDVVDTGLSSRYVVDLIARRGAKNVELLALFDRPTRRIVSVPLRYVGRSDIADYVVGYGLDHAERFRNLANVFAVSPELLEAASGNFAKAVYEKSGYHGSPSSG